MNRLLPVFILLPIAELLLLFNVGHWLGVIPTILLVITTAMIGVQLLQQQGLRTLAQIQGQLQQGILPEQQLLEGLLLLFAGALLLTPGLITDTLGFCCLIPGSRSSIARHLMGSVLQGMMVQPRPGTGSYTAQDPPPRQGDILEGEYISKDDNPRRR